MASYESRLSAYHSACEIAPLGGPIERLFPVRKAKTDRVPGYRLQRTPPKYPFATELFTSGLSVSCANLATLPMGEKVLSYSQKASGTYLYFFIARLPDLL